MIMWVLLVSLNVQSAIAYASHEACADAASKLKVPAMCVAFAADVSDGKTL